MDHDGGSEHRAAGGRLSEADAAELARQVAGLAGAGRPLPGGLRALGQELGRAPLRRVLFEAADRLEAGEPLDEILAAQARHFPAHLAGLVQAGRRSGRLAALLGQYARIHRVGADLRRKLWVNLAYPVVLLGSFVIVVGFLLLVVVGQFETIFADFGVDLPVTTRLVIWLARGIRRGGIWIVLGPAIVLGTLALIERLALDAPRRRHFATRLPLVGPLWRWASLAEYFQLLALLLDARIPLPEALPLAGSGARDAALELASRRMAGEIAGGRSLADALRVRRPFPDGLGSLLAWAESRGALADALRMIAEMFEARARAQTAFVGTVCLIGSVLIVVLGIGLPVVSLFLPLIQLIGNLSG